MTNITAVRKHKLQSEDDCNMPSSNRRYPLRRIKSSSNVNTDNNGDIRSDGNSFYPLAGHCDRCNKLSVFRCHRCSAVFYCSRRCQRVRWPTHQLTCSPRLFAPLTSQSKSIQPTRAHILLPAQAVGAKIDVHASNGRSSSTWDEDAAPLKVDHLNEATSTTISAPFSSPTRSGPTVDTGRASSAGQGGEADADLLMDLLGLSGHQDRDQVRSALAAFGDVNRAAEWLLSGADACSLPPPLVPIGDNVVPYTPPSMRHQSKRKGRAAAVGRGAGDGPEDSERALKASVFAALANKFDEFKSSDSVAEGEWVGWDKDSFGNPISASRVPAVESAPPLRTAVNTSPNDVLMDNNAAPSAWSVRLFSGEREIAGRHCIVEVSQASATDFTTAVRIRPREAPGPHQGSTSAADSGIWPVHVIAISAGDLLGLFRIHVEEGSSLLQESRAGDRAETLLGMLQESREASEDSSDDAIYLFYKVVGKRGAVYGASAGELVHENLSEEISAQDDPSPGEGDQNQYMNWYPNPPAHHAQPHIGSSSGASGDDSLFLRACSLVEMFGVELDRASAVLAAFDGDVEQSADWLLTAPLSSPPPAAGRSANFYGPAERSDVRQKGGNRRFREEHD